MIVKVKVLYAFLLSAQCMLTYWEIRNRLIAVRCPSCRQQVTVSLFTFGKLFIDSENEVRNQGKWAS